MVPHLIFNLITQVIFGKVYKLWSSLLCCLLQPSATSVLGPAHSSHTPSSHSLRDQIQNNRKNYGFVYFDLSFREETGRHKILNRMVTSILHI
jgi:hypothetical protein